MPNPLHLKQFSIYINRIVYLCFILAISFFARFFFERIPSAAGDGLSSVVEVTEPTAEQRWQPASLAEMSALAIATGSRHACAVTDSGALFCWGQNDVGQLGNGTTELSALPVQVNGLPGSVTAVYIKQDRTCALTGTGAVYCWGDDVLVPTVVDGLSSGVASVTMGAVHACALTDAGGIKCWGENTTGQLGNGTTTSSEAAVDVTGLTSGVSELALSPRHSCALTTGGGVKCWGDNEIYGWLGDGTNNQSSIPVDVFGLTSGVTTIAVADGEDNGFSPNPYTCALTSLGGIKCWGNNSASELGEFPVVYQNRPVDVDGLTANVSAIALSSNFGCALITQTQLQCWGDGLFPVGSIELSRVASSIRTGWETVCVLFENGGVQCWGDDLPDIIQANSAERTIEIASASTISIGPRRFLRNTYACIITNRGAIQCWGDNEYGQLGRGTRSPTIGAVEVSAFSSDTAAIALGSGYSCEVTDAGAVRCFGLNDSGQLGDGTSTTRHTPAEVVGLTGGFGSTRNVASIVTGRTEACALSTTGDVKCWGNGATVAAPVSGLAGGIKSITLGSSHNCVVTGSNGVQCWGSNSYGQLGDGTDEDSETPTDVIGLAGPVVAVVAGGEHTCALTEAGAVQCWGNNEDGQLGNDSEESSSTPVNVVGLESGIVAITTGPSEFHTCALTSAGGVKCWGDNNDGELGDGADATYSTTPVDVIGLSSGVIDFGIGSSFSCALTAAGGVKCWGFNFGRLGNGMEDASTTPVDVIGLSSGVTEISIGRNHSCAMTTNGVRCWGINDFGELGTPGVNFLDDVSGFEALPLDKQLYLPLISNAIP